MGEVCKLFPLRDTGNIPMHEPVRLSLFDISPSDCFSSERFTVSVLQNLSLDSMFRNNDRRIHSCGDCQIFGRVWWIYLKEMAAQSPFYFPHKCPMAGKKVWELVSLFQLCLTRPILSQLWELQNPTHDVSVLHKIRRSLDLEVLKLGKG